MSSTQVKSSQNAIEHSLPKEFLQGIQSNFSEGFLTTDPQDLMNYGTDWTRNYQPAPSAIAFPRSTEEVSRLLKLCLQYRVAVVPSGGRTGLAGGAVAARGELVLSLEKMNQMGPVDPLSQTVHVQAGAITEAVHLHCAPQGLTWPVDFASKGSSQVGGNISTNAGGVKVIRYGLTRNWILGLKVVTMNGDILSLNGALEKNNTGIDLRQVFIGSEGILGVVTEATLKLSRLPGDLDVFFFAVEDTRAVLKLFEFARRAPFQIMAFEFLTHNCLRSVVKERGMKSPFEAASGAYVLLEVERPLSEEARKVLDQWLEDVFSQGLVNDGTLAQSSREASDLWSLREGVSESITNQGFTHKNDIALPISNLGNFVEEMVALFATRNPELEIFIFGHIGDGNLHVNTLKPDGMDRGLFLRTCEKADGDLFQLVQKYEGSVSAEHGIGLLKKSALHFSRTPAEIALMKSMKKTFDPLGLLNPGKIFDVSH